MDRVMNQKMANLLLTISLVNCLVHGFAWSKEGGVVGDSIDRASGKGEKSGEKEELQRLREEIANIDDRTVAKFSHYLW